MSYNNREFGPVQHGLWADLLHLVVAASNASMRDVRSLTDLVSSVEILSASMLHVLMVSMVVTSFNWLAWRDLTSANKRSSFSSVVDMRADRVGGFFPQSRGLGSGGGSGGGGGLGDFDGGGGSEVEVMVVDGARFLAPAGQDRNRVAAV